MKRKTLTGLATALVMITSAIPYTVSADENVIYGTMNIPYAEFYAGEFGTSTNAYEVDAYSSATTSKWSKNGVGELFEGTFNQANDDSTGMILGVTYPVAITQAELDELGENNYSFTPVDYVPSAYKNVTVSDGTVSFSAVQDSTPTTADGATVKLSTSTPWGDYLIDIENKPEMSAIYGALIKTSDNMTYAMRHEENIWRGELAWSSGIKTTEPHGNSLSYENFTTLMGATITEVTFITADGYIIIPTETYVPVKFEGEVNVTDSTAGTGSTNFELVGFPEDFEKSYYVSEGFEVTESEITYTNVMPASYTLTVSDVSGKYADYSGNFTLTTDIIPAIYGENALVKADNASDDDFANFIKNIAKVSINGKGYSASGKGAVKIIGEDGTIDFSASSRDGNVFDGSGNYTVSVIATGYTSSLDFEIKADAPETTTAQSTTTITDTTTNKTTTTTATSTKNSSSTTTKNNTVSSTDSPKTGDAGMAIPMTFIALAGVTAIISRKKKD